MHLLDAMQVFLRVAELGSFTRAAETLGRPKASVSLAVQRLEAELGTRLLHRTTRRVGLTRDGEMLARRAHDLLGDLDELRDLFRADARGLRGRLRVGMSTRFAERTVLPRLHDFLAAHPDLELELSTTDRFVDLVAEGFDCVVRGGTPTDSRLVARPLGTYALGNFASPAYLARHGIPRTPADLAGHVLVRYANPLGSDDGFDYVEDGRVRRVPMRSRVSVDGAAAYDAACIAGLGLIQTPRMSVAPQLAAGTLVEVLPEYVPPPLRIALLYPHRRHLSPRVRAFADWLEGLLREAHDLQPARPMAGAPSAAT
ncbi:LysR substrate-binding domain-containing protein [Coralloluteibacterium thermophilus]|uniref:LysR substrate-binding domain-containing protein n=1 Tax=Coralloluteibacterium thermophilum TaxID=2707049 RepID=A0ABV9NG81_9GAMM